MPRPFKCRRISGNFRIDYFKPRGVPLCSLDEVCIGVDELEAVRLADLDGLYQADAAEIMKISRQTFGNIIEAAHRKIADALVNGKALKIEGGPVAQANDESDNAHEHGFHGHGRGRGKCRHGGND